MGKTKDLGHLAHMMSYDASNNITLPANLTVAGTITGYATTSSLGSYVPTSRTITINGTAYDLSENRSWNITSMIYPAAGIALSTGSAWGTSITNNSANWNTAYGWGNHASAGYITSSGSITGSAGSVSGLTLTSSANGINPDSVTQNQIGYNTSVSLFGQTDGGLYSSAYNSSWIHQIYGDFRTGQIAIRGKNNGSWTGWRTVIDSGNIGSQSVNYASSAGSASSATSATYLGSGGYIYRGGYSSNCNTDFQNTPVGSYRYNGDEPNQSNSPGGTWWFTENFRHSNASNYWGTQIAWGWEDNSNRLAQRNISANSFSGWVYYLNSGNYTSYYNYGRLNSTDIYNTGWFRNYGYQGIYNQDYGCHFRPNASSSHGSWEIYGYNKNGYNGFNIQDPQGYNNNLMYENGNGGMYTQNANGWQWYYNRGSNCIGLGGSTTYNWVRAVVDGKLKIESDTIHTGWAYFDSNVQFSGGNTQYHQTNEYYNWRDWGGWGGYWINRNGGDMIMNLYALYAVTGGISDIRYKKDIEALPYGLNEIMQLNPIKFHYNLPKESMLANDPDYFLGFSAQEVQQIIPEAVHEKVGEDTDSMKGMLAITYDELIPVTVQAIKEQQVMIRNQNNKINKLEALVNQLLNN